VALKVKCKLEVFQQLILSDSLSENRMLKHPQLEERLAEFVAVQEKFNDADHQYEQTEILQ
jgi:hypothetical protein